MHKRTMNITRIQHQLFVSIVCFLLAIPALPVAYRSVFGGYENVEPGDGSAGFRSQIEGFVDRNIGLGDKMQVVAIDMRNFGTRSEPVVEGLDGWLFFNSGNLRRRPEGKLYDAENIKLWYDLANTLYAYQKSRGRAFVFFSAPDKTSIYPEKLPARYQWDVSQPDSLELLHRKLAASAIPFADIRGTLRSAKQQHQLYDEVDTHWNRLGALIAFNSVLSELGMEEKAIPVARVLRGFETQKAAEQLVAMSGKHEARFVRRPVFSENPFETRDLAIREIDGNEVNEHRRRLMAASNRAALDGKLRPRVYLIGDSFTKNYFTPLLARTFGSVHWTHHDHGKIDWQAIEAADPDIIILEIVERILN